MNQYETVFILTPVLSEDQMKEAVKKYEDFLTKKNGAEIVHRENWGMRKLAYPIQKKSSGFYQILEYKANPEAVSPLEVEFKRDERILRFLTVKLDKHAIAYNEKRRKKLKEEKKEVKEEKA